MKKYLLKFISFILASVLFLTGCGITDTSDSSIPENDSSEQEDFSGCQIETTTLSDVSYTDTLYDIDDVSITYSFGTDFYMSDDGTYLYPGDISADFCNLEIYIENEAKETFIIKKIDDWYVSEKYYCRYDYMNNTKKFNHTEEVTIPEEVFTLPSESIWIGVRGEKYINGEATGEVKQLNSLLISYQKNRSKIKIKEYDFTAISSNLWYEDTRNQAEIYKHYEPMIRSSYKPPFKKSIEAFAVNSRDGKLAVCSSIDNKKIISVYNSEWPFSIILNYDGELLIEWDSRNQEHLLLYLIDDGIILPCEGVSGLTWNNKQFKKISDYEDNETYINEVLRSTSQTTEDGITYTLENKSILSQMSGNNSYSKISAKDNEGNEWVIYDAKVSRVSEFVPGLGTALWFIIQKWNLIFNVKYWEL